jgi:hypothetical protein
MHCWHGVGLDKAVMKTTLKTTPKHSMPRMLRWVGFTAACVSILVLALAIADKQLQRSNVSPLPEGQYYAGTVDMHSVFNNLR